MSSDNYAFDYYTWELDKQCADKVARELVARVLKKALKPDRKAAIQYALRTNDFANYPDSDSDDSIATIEMNEIHYDDPSKKRKTKRNYFCWRKRKYSYTL
jgi:hypothetical protein